MKRAPHGSVLLGVLFVGGALLASGSAIARDKAKPQTLGDLKPPSIEIRREARVDASAARAMENYRKFLELQKTDPSLRAEALRRLGDLNLEAGELERMEKEVSSLDIQGAEAIRLYTLLLKAYPDYPRNDEVLYQLARAYETTAQSDLALATLERIVTRYPNAVLMPEVDFRRGEILFSARRWVDAQRAYERVIARGAKGQFYNQSLYKHGWALFKQGLSEDSLPSFMGVLDSLLLEPANKRKLRPDKSLSRPDTELVEDTLRVSSITFSYLDGAASLEAYLAKGERPAYAHMLYSRLGDLFVEKQRWQDAAASYRAYVAKDPNSEYAPGLAMQAIEAYGKGGFGQLVLDGKRDFVERYNFSSGFWQGRERGKYPAIEGALRVNLKDVATWYHSTAQSSKKVADYEQAARWYRDYLQSFPDADDSAATNYLLAETLFESLQFAAAAEEYQRTAYDYPRNAKSAAAAYASLAAYDRHEAGLTGDPKTEWHRRSIDAGVRFAKTFPEHPDSGGVLTRAAQDIFKQGDLPRAIEVAQAVLDHQPAVDMPKQRIAWTVIAQSNFDLGQFAPAEQAFVRARDLVPAGDPMRKDLSERLAAAVYKQGEAKRSAGDGAGAVDDFLRVAQLAPDSPVRTTAEYDAAAQLITLKQWSRAIGVLEGFRRNWPQSQLQSDVTRKLAVAYVEAGRPGDAAVEFERIAANSAESADLRREALASAADNYEKAGNTARTVAVLERYVAQYPSPFADALDSRQRLADFAAKAGDAARLQFWQKEIIKADAAAGDARTDRSRLLAARAQLALTVPARDAFRAIKLVAPLKKSLTAKRKALEAARNAYRTAMDYRVAEVTTAATYETAELYRQLGKDIMKSERPRKMNKEEREQYDTLLEEQAFPFEEQAIGIHEVNAARAREGLWDDSVKASFAALAELKPGRYAKTEQVVSAPVLAAATAARQSGDLAGAEELLTKQVNGTASDLLVFAELGYVQRLRGKFADARVSYEKAVALDATYAPAQRNLGVLLDLFLDDPVAALAAFERYRALTGEEKPVSGWIAELKPRVAKLAKPAAEPAAPPTEPAKPATEPAGGGT